MNKKEYLDSMFVSIEAAWQEYARQVMPPSAPEVQRVVMRRTFYAGFIDMLGRLIVGSEDPEAERV